MAKPVKEEIILQGILQCLIDAKAQNLIHYHVSELVSYTDEVIITTGMSGTHVKSLVSKVEEYCKEKNFNPYSRIRKRESYEWIVLDYYYIIIHIFQESERTFYDLDSVFQKNLPPENINYWEQPENQ